MGKGKIIQLVQGRPPLEAYLFRYEGGAVTRGSFSAADMTLRSLPLYRGIALLNRVASRPEKLLMGAFSPAEGDIDPETLFVGRTDGIFCSIKTRLPIV